MNMEDIISRHNELERRLHIALATMERKSTIYEIKKEMREIQNVCPHFSNEYNYAMVDGYCPYCGKKLEEAR